MESNRKAKLNYKITRKKRNGKCMLTLRHEQHSTYSKIHVLKYRYLLAKGDKKHFSSHIIQGKTQEVIHIHALENSKYMCVISLEKKLQYIRKA